MSTRNPYQPGSTSRVGKKRTASQYGQACLPCFKNKSKCVRHDNADSCERCIRLKKECSSAESLRKRATQKPSDAAATIASLKAKIDGLNTLLNEVVEGSASPSALREVLQERQQGTEPLYETRKLPISERTPTTSSDWKLSPDQELTRLSIFRERMLPFLAFVDLPPDFSAQKLREEKPLLFQAIMAVTSPSAQEKRVRGNELKSIITQKTWGGIDTSLDLLLCILTYLCWGYDTFINNVTISSPSRLTQIAMAVAYDLRVNTSGPIGSYLFPGEVMSAGLGPGRSRSPEETAQEKLENKRAILGCFLLSSLTASHYRRMEPMRWTPQMEEYLDTLGRAKESVADVLFCLQVRLQALAQQVSEEKDQRQLERYQTIANLTPGNSTEPLLNRWYLEAVQRKIHEITALIPPHLKSNEILLSQLYYTSLSIYETIHPVSADVEYTPSFNISSTLYERDCHYHTLQAIRSFFDNFSRFNSLHWAGFPFHFWAQSVRCTAVLIRLSFPADHRDEVRNTVDVLTVMDSISERIKGAAVEVGETSSEDLFGKLYRASRALYAYISAKLQPPPEQQHTSLPWTEAPVWGDSGFDPGSIDATQMLMMQWLGFNDPIASATMSFSSPALYYNYMPDM